MFEFRDDVEAAHLTRSFIPFQGDFDSKVEAAGNKLVVLDFHATWCGPCKMIAPFLEELSSSNAEKIVVLKVNNCGVQHDVKTKLIFRFSFYRSMLTNVKNCRFALKFPACQRLYS